jgi:hypothetical protein
MASSVMGRPDEGHMHRVAAGSAPRAIADYERFVSKAKTRLAAVERHNCDWRDGSKPVEERFLWVKVRDVSGFPFSPVRLSYYFSALCSEQDNELK